MRTLFSSLIFCLLFLTGCELFQSNSGSHRDLWESKNITSYSFEYNRGCFCAYRGPVVVVVKNSQITNILDPTTNQPFSPARSADWYETIDQIFDEIDELKAGKPQTLDVTYDPTYGFPNSINYNQSDMIADEEFNLTITNFKILP